MRGQPEQSQDPADWFEIADEDLHVARECLAHDPPIVRASCFHAQQAAEKYMKGYLVDHRVEFPWTHDLMEILRLCERQDPEFQVLQEPAADLTELAVAPRYPFPPFVATRDEAREAISAAERIAAFVRERVKL